MQTINSYYPVISTLDGERLVQFFTANLDFIVVYESDWYWHLTMKDQPTVNIAFVQANHESVPEAYRQSIQGLLLNIEMKDIDAYYAQSLQKDWNIVLPLKSEDWGQKHFIVETPVPGLLIDFIEVIAPSKEFLDNYQQDEATVS